MVSGYENEKRQSIKIDTDLPKNSNELRMLLDDQKFEK